MLQKSPMYAYIPAKDVARARTVLRGQARLQAQARDRRRRGLRVRRGHRLLPVSTPNAGTSKASQAFWQVDDVEREVAELKSRGVEFEDYDMPGEKSPSGVVTARRRQGRLVQGQRGQHHGGHTDPLSSYAAV